MSSFIHRPTITACIEQIRKLALATTQRSMTHEEREAVHATYESIYNTLTQFVDQQQQLDRIDWSQVADFYTFIVRLCYLHDASMTGGCRTARRNAKVGGVFNSKHQFFYEKVPGAPLVAGWGMAIDLWFDHPDDCERAKPAITKAGYHWVQPGHYNKRRLHTQSTPYGAVPRWTQFV